MAQTFNSPPGWPKPPEGWTPPPGWAPDPTWPQAPEGWQFWSEDPFQAALGGTGAVNQPSASTSPSQPSSAQPGAPASTQTGPPSTSQPGQQHDPQSTQTLGTTPTQAFPPSSAQPPLYTYAPTAGLDQPGASPYGPQGAPPQGGFNPGPGGYPGSGAYQGGQYSSPGAPAPKSRNPLAIVGVALVAVLVLGGIVWGLIATLSGGDEDPTAGEPSTTAAPTDDPTTDDPTTDPPTDDPTTDDPTTDDPTTDDPTDPATTPDGGGDTSGGVDLTGSQPAILNGGSGEPVVEVRLVQAVAGWESSTPSSLCSPPENGQYLGLELEFTTLPALAEESTPNYSFIGWELGAEVDGVAIETNAFSTGLFCLGTDERPQSEMQPGETYTGWAVLDVPESVTAVTFADLFDFTGEAPVYRWVLADQ